MLCVRAVRLFVGCRSCLRAAVPLRCAGPSMMPGGSPEAYKYIKDIVEKVAAQVCAGWRVTRVDTSLSTDVAWQ